jgi:hypothetical protein
MDVEPLNTTVVPGSNGSVAAPFERHDPSRWTGFARHQPLKLSLVVEPGEQCAGIQYARSSDGSGGWAF